MYLLFTIIKLLTFARGISLNMECYHGSSSKPFDRFSLDHALEGDGKVKFGWGVYVTERYNSAAHYAFNKKRPQNTDYYVYTVLIPARTPNNCLSLLKGVPVTDSIVRRTEKKLNAKVPAAVISEGIPFRKWLAGRLGGEKEASEFLSSIGVDLIEWPYNWKNPTAEKNYAVLDDKNVRIVRIEKVGLDPRKHQLIEGSRQIIKTF